jgi:hypothetical protein
MVMFEKYATFVKVLFNSVEAEKSVFSFLFYADTEPLELGYVTFGLETDQNQVNNYKQDGDEAKHLSYVQQV